MVAQGALGLDVRGALVVQLVDEEPEFIFGGPSFFTSLLCAGKSLESRSTDCGPASLHDAVLTVVWHQRQRSPVMPLYDLTTFLQRAHLPLQLPSTQWCCGAPAVRLLFT